MILPQIPLLERPKPAPAKRPMAISKPEASKRAKVASSPPQEKSLSGIAIKVAAKSKKKKVEEIPENILDSSLSGMVFKEDPGLDLGEDMYEGDFKGDVYGEGDIGDGVFEDEANLGEEMQEEGTADEAVKNPDVKADAAGKNCKCAHYLL